MSGLEDGEIESDHEPEVLQVSGDFNDEILIDKFVENANEAVRQASSSPLVVITNEDNRKIQPACQTEKPKRSFLDGRRRRPDPKRKSSNSSLNVSKRSMPTSTTWHSGNNHTPRPAPLESVIFPPSSSYDPPRTVDPTICRLQTLMSHTRDANYYPPVDNPPIYFNPSLSAPPPPPPLPPPPPILPVSFNFLNPVSPGGLFRGGDYNAVDMEESDDAAEQLQQLTSRPKISASFAGIVAHPPVPPSGELLAAQRKILSTKGTGSTENNIATNTLTDDFDEGALRQKAIDSIRRQKRRSARNSQSSVDKQQVSPKKSKTSSTSTVKATSKETVSPVKTSTVPTVSPVKISTAPPVSHQEPETPLSPTDSVKAKPSPVIIPTQALDFSTHSVSISSFTVENSMRDLRDRRAILEQTYEEKLKRIPKLKAEAEDLLKRFEQIQTLIASEKEELKEVATEKREIQRIIDDKELAEMDIVCDETQFLNFRVPIVKIEKPQELMQSVPSTPIAEPKVESVREINQTLSISAHGLSEQLDEKEEEDEMSDVSSSDDTDMDVISDDNDSDGKPEDEDFRSLDNQQLNLQPVSDDSDAGGKIKASLSAEMSLREKLLAKCLPRQSQSPDATVQVSSSSEHSEKCRNLLLSMCKFGFNGICGRGRECTHLHLHQINDTTRQVQLLESIFRDVLSYNEVDIEKAIKEVLVYLPQFQDYEKLIQQFMSIVMKQTPAYRVRLFELLPNGR